MTAYVKVFGCRPLTNGAAHSGGRLTKTSKGPCRLHRMRAAPDAEQAVKEAIAKYEIS
jgi:hypothetical protein